MEPVDYIGIIHVLDVKDVESSLLIQVKGNWKKVSGSNRSI